jgi:ATP phosphoribosyltransferase
MFEEVTVAIAKGRILDGAAALWSRAQLPWPLSDGTRQLWFRARPERPGVIVARSRDIPTLVAHGVADLGIVGWDILKEYPEPGVLEVADLGFSRCRVVLAGTLPHWPKGPSRIATKYRRITEEYFRQRQHPIEIVPLSGSLELAPVLNLAPYIVDIVDTGRTLREHGLREVTTLFASTARLIANPSLWRSKPAMLLFRQRLLQGLDPSTVLERGGQ